MLPGESMSEVESQEPLLPLPNLVGSESISNSPVQNVIKNKTKDNQKNTKDSNKQFVKKKAESETSSVPDLNCCSGKSSESSTDKLLMTLMEEVKNLIMQINTPMRTPQSVSQTSSSSSNMPVNKFEPCMRCGKRNHHESMCFPKPSDQVTNVSQRPVLVKSEGRPNKGTTPRNKHLISKSFPECIYYGCFDHHLNNCDNTLDVIYVEVLLTCP